MTSNILTIQGQRTDDLVDAITSATEEDLVIDMFFNFRRRLCSCADTCIFPRTWFNFQFITEQLRKNGCLQCFVEQLSLELQSRFIGAVIKIELRPCFQLLEMELVSLAVLFVLELGTV